MPPVLFASVPEPERSLFVKACKPQRFGPGDVVVSEGDVGDSLYLVARGRAVVRSTTPDGEVVTFDIVGPGSVLGLVGFVREGHRRTASVVALDEVTMRVMTAPVYAEMRRRHPGVERALSILMADTVERLSAQLLEAHYLPVGQRIARRLLRVAAMGGPIESGIVLPVTQQDVADLAGAARPTVNQALKRLEAAGAIALSRGRLEIVDADVLQQHA